jgi:hypothetical protein
MKANKQIPYLTLATSFLGCDLNAAGAQSLRAVVIYCPKGEHREIQSAPKKEVGLFFTL